MKVFGKDLESDTPIVAEVGVNHEGDIEAASRLLRLAAESGADAVKFQSYTPGRYASASDRERLERVSRFALDESAHRRLAKEAAALKVSFFSTPLTEDMVPLLDELCPAIKIASGDLTFEPVIRAAAHTNKPILLSTGGGTMDEIQQAISWVAEVVGESLLPERLVLMHCVSAYPTPVEQANVRAVPFLADYFGIPVGYSNHVIGIDACLAAVALGASIIEAHFTDSKSGRTFRDHELSLEPQELSELVIKAGRIRASLGHPAKEPAPCEIENISAMRKGIVAARDLSANTELTRENLMYARPAIEFSATEISELVGRRITESVSAGELIRRGNVTPG